MGSYSGCLQVEGGHGARQTHNGSTGEQVQGTQMQARPGGCGCQDRHQRGQRTAAGIGGGVAVAAPTSALAHASRPAGPGVGCRGGAHARRRAVADGGDGARGTAAPPSRAVRRRGAAHAAAARRPVACRARRRARDLLRAGAPTRPARAVGLHRGRRVGHQPGRSGLPAPAVPVRAGPQRLAPCARGAGRRELPEPCRRAAGRAVDGRWRAAGAPHR